MQPSKKSHYAPKTRTPSGHSVPQYQSVAVPKSLENCLTILPSLTAPAFGGYFICDLKNKNIEIHNLSLSFTATSILNGLSYAGSGSPAPAERPYFVPIFQWIERVEICVNNQIIDTLYGQDMFIKNQLFYNDKARLANNNAAGNYANVAQRQQKSTTQSEWILNLHTFCNEASYSVLTNSNEIQLRVFMNTIDGLYTIPNLVSGGSGPAYTGSPSVSLSCAVVSEEVNLSKSGLAVSRLNTLRNTPTTQLFHDTRYFLTNIQPTNSARIILTSITGSVAFLYFLVQTNNGKGDNSYKFSPIQSFALYSASNQNIVGGQTISDTNNRKLLSQWSQSSYINEWAGGSNLVGQTTDNGASVYFWSFSADPISAISNGQALGSYWFQGQEVLEVNFTPDFAGGSASAQIQVFASTEQMLNVSATNVSKIALQ